MQEKLKELALRYEDLQAQLADPSVYGDAERLKTVNRELKDLTPVAEAYQAYRQGGGGGPSRGGGAALRPGDAGVGPGGADRRTGRDGAATAGAEAPAAAQGSQ